MSNISEISIKDLWDAGVHFGHKTSNWNPKMSPYIYGQKNKLHIIDLRQTLVLLKEAQKAIYECVKNNGRILFVGSKIQASSIVAEYAKKCGQYYVSTRWLGGTLTNWVTISKSIKKLDEIEKIIESSTENQIYTKKELLDLSRTRDKLLKSLGGIRDMGGKPDLMIVMDTKEDRVSIDEAKKLDVPVIAICDTDSNPTGIKHVVPGNDDAVRAITLYCKAFAESALAGIEESLIASGVDIGGVSDIQDAPKVRKVAKTEQKKKYTSKAAKKIDEAVSEEFQKIIEE